MIQYKKENETYTLGQTMDLGSGKTIIPTHDWLVDNGWVAYTLPETTPAPTEQRKQAYANEPIVEWEGETLTIDEANALFMAYLAEGNTEVTTALTDLIMVGKAEIRGRISD